MLPPCRVAGEVLFSLTHWGSVMHVLSPLAHHLRVLAGALRAARVELIHDRVGMVLAEITGGYALRRPQSPEDRAEWDRHMAPALAALATCEEIVASMTWPVTRSGLIWSPLWLRYLLSEVRQVIALPPLDSIYTDTPEQGFRGPIQRVPEGPPIG